ncbi:MAG: glycoside hydrolase family 127 protein [Lachnospiraceae bacterium]|nr:glycoside hydrolase family 127 protein [Lachnospiraceae bacterium]
MKELSGREVKLFDGELLMKERCNTAYLKELTDAALLQNYYQEAGLHQNFGSKAMAHGGWEDPSCQLRGHFLGHFLSAAAMNYAETGDEELLAKANFIVGELKHCQAENGAGWVAAIPEKYFHWIARGKAVWAPHYNVHKLFMGLVDMYRYTGNEQALEVAVAFSKWFYDFTDGMNRKQLDDLLDFETGGMLEIWADLYEITKDEMYLTLIDRYDRHRLFDPLLAGVDVLTNMHANTTIPEAIGALRVYEVTGNERYRDIAFAYWKCAVTDRGSFVTGGQTLGEIWTPMLSMAARLGEKNQEHCTVYNMMRLADGLFKLTGDAQYLDYIERNLYNGILAQGHFRGGHSNGQTPEYPEEGLITYFLPLYGGGRKGWGTKTQDFFCCHGTLVQANAAHNRFLYYQDKNDIYAGLYFASRAEFTLEDGTKIAIAQRRDALNGSYHFSSTDSSAQTVREEAHIYLHQPDTLAEVFRIETEGSAQFALNLRVPAWVGNEAANNRCARILVNGIPINAALIPGKFVRIDRTWQNGDEVRIELPLRIRATLLPGTDDMVAFSYGPIVLAGLCDAERLLHTKGAAPETLLVHDCEREWGMWKMTFKTRGQDPGIRFVPLYQIGYERYQVYFPIEE